LQRQNLWKVAYVVVRQKALGNGHVQWTMDKKGGYFTFHTEWSSLIAGATHVQSVAYLGFGKGGAMSVRVLGTEIHQLGLVLMDLILSEFIKYTICDRLVY